MVVRECARAATRRLATPERVPEITRTAAEDAEQAVVTDAAEDVGLDVSPFRTRLFGYAERTLNKKTRG